MISQKRSLMVLLLVLAILASACQANASAAQSQTSTATVSRGTLAATISAAGTIAAQAQVSVQFQNSGQVKAVNVKVGDTVHAGQVMASLDTAELETEVASAQAALESAQAKLALAKQAPSDSEVKAAEAALASAQATLRAAQNEAAHLGDQVTIEKASLDNAAQRLSDAQGTYSNLLEYQCSGAQGRGAPYVPPAGQEWSQEKAALDNAQVDYQVAVANYNLAKAEVNNSSIESAAAQVASAQATLNSLKNTPASADVQLAELAVQTAQIALDQAKLDLKGSQLVAPFDGVVAVVNIQVGQQVSSSTEAITVANLSQLEAQVDVSETDLPSIKVGQSVQLTFDALTGQTFTGTVANVALVGTTSSGVVNYPVTIALDPTDAAIRPGMTANVSIVVEQHNNVLLVPNRAVKTSGKQKIVTVLQEGKSTQVVVTLGLSGDTQSEVTSGLSESDVVVIQQTTTTSSNQGGSGAGGLGGPPMGGF
jgi:HlyD family secretion protein